MRACNSESWPQVAHNHDESKADPTSMGCFLVHNNGTLPLIEQSLHRLLVVTAPMLKAGDYLK